MRTRRSLLLAGVVIGILMLTCPPSAQPPVPLASFYGIGDLPGGLTTSIVRDATKVGGTIYAVGSSAAAANPNLDTAAIWTFDGANPATLTELPLNTLGEADRPPRRPSRRAPRAPRSSRVRRATAYPAPEVTEG